MPPSRRADTNPADWGTPPYRILPAGEKQDDAEDDDTEDDHGDHEENRLSAPSRTATAFHAAR